MHLNAIDESGDRPQIGAEPLEELLPHLKYHYRNGWLHHPYVVDMLSDPQRAGHQNRRYRETKELVERALDARDWHGYVFWHQRFYRLNAFLRISDQLGGEDYWSLLGNIWTDSGNISQNKKSWRECWNSSRPKKEAAMDEDDRKRFDELAETTVVYRGQDRRNTSGISWSSDRDQAIWFATHRHRRPEHWVLTGRVKKIDVHAAFAGKEQEIVANKVRVVARERLIVSKSRQRSSAYPGVPSCSPGPASDTSW